jgi:glycosyltransferase involved in cell wall biosynthesis
MARQFKNSGAEMAEPIRILHVLPDKERRLRPLENLVNGLDRVMFSQIVCYLRGHDKVPTELEKQGYDVITLDISKKRLRKFQPRVVLQLAKIIKERGIDIVHCQRHKPTVYGTLAAYKVGVQPKVIGHVRGLHRTRTFRRRLINRLLSGRISRIITVSAAVRDDIIRNNSKAFAAKVVTIYNGIDVQLFVHSNLTREDAKARIGIPDKKVFVYGTVGRLVETKGQIILLQAFAQISRECPQSWLVFAGDGRLESELRRLAAELGIQESVMFLGHRHDIPEVLKAYDVFVLPSVAEGLPGALLEAMATGLPVIASRVGGVPEILNIPELDTMVPPRSVDDLASAMKALYKTSVEERDKIGKALRERVLQEFSKEKMISAMTAEYLTVMNMTLESWRAGT